jgi:hypothetical protein
MEISIFLMVLIGIVALVFLLVGYLIFEQFVLYPHEFTLKLMTNKTPIVIRTRAKETKDDNKQPVWQLLHKKLKVPVPDASVRSITKKGKYYVEGWLFSDGQVQYEKNSNVKVQYEDIAEPVATEMLTSEQRIMLAHQFKKAEIERGKNLKEWLMQIAMPLGMALILGGVIIFGMVQWTDINGPGLQFADKMVALEKEDTRQLEILQEISNDVQIIKAREGLSNTDVPGKVEPPN